MAASRENFLSLGHLTGTERNTFTKQREQSLKKSVNRPVLLQPDFLSPQSHHQLEVMHLQQRWQELKERELKAQQHNRLLLQQFDEAQDTLSEMITLTAAMKTIRKEYERYLEESSPRWQQQLKEKTQAAQRKRMEEYLRSCPKNTEDHVIKFSADQPSLSQGPSTMPKEIAAPPKHYSTNSHLDYNQDGSPHLLYMQSSRQTYPQSQMARFPIRAPYQPQGSSHVPPSFLPPRIFPPPHSFQLNHLSSTPGHHHPSPRQNPPGWASLQPDYPWSWAAGAAGIPPGSEPLWGQLYMEEPPPETGVAQVAGEEADTSRAPSSKRERGGGDRSSHASQELDIKPVRLSDGHAESSESSQVSREKRKKRQERGRSQCSSSDRERCSSQKSSRTSSAIVIAAVTVAQSSESDDSSVKGRTSTSRRMRRSGGLAVESPRAEKVAKGSKGVDSGSHKEESQSTSEELQSVIEESRSEKVGNQSPDDKSENYREESASQREEQSGSVTIRIENGGGAEMEKQESSSSEQSSGKEKAEEDLADDGDAEEKENSPTDGEKAERDVEDNDDASERKNKAEEEEETEEKDEESEGDHEENQSDRLKNEDGENRQQGSASSQDEEVDEDEREGGEDNMEEDGESDEEEEGAGEEEEEQRRDETGEAEKESDSEDSIISPQDKSKKMHTIAEEAREDDDDEEEGGSKMGSSDDDSKEFSDEDDVEHLLAPQEQSQKKEEKDPRADEKPEAICDNVDIFQVDNSTKSDHPSDSDEFDNFYG
ncbi:ABC transporter F family member 4-like isoform X2 [Sander lucioperca]|uniref:ABC transporter F family member 4-like isoform X2 n=1 Tax=Sander lucioperca TaxID=283035 RepID=UPI0016535669|nr:ABC transporter F family member 4-like isoform X2 [Sander lucioperca]